MPRILRSLARVLPIALAAAALPAMDGCSASSVPLVDRPAGIRVDATSITPNSPTNRLPITFRSDQAKSFTVDLTVFDDGGATRTSFDGRNAWVRLSVQPGQIVDVQGPAGPDDPNVVGHNVHLVNGQMKGLTVQVVGAYGDTRIVASDVGFVPGPVGGISQCQDGIDNDGNGLADYPIDPGCYFLNDDLEGPGTGAYGVSSVLYYAFPRIHDVQGGTVASQFVAKQVEIPGDATKRMIVTAVTNDGMYVTDIDDDARGFNSLFVFNFSAPYGVRVCDQLTRLAGNVSNFYGFTELGTPGWSVQPWISDERSGPCPITGFKEITDTLANDKVNMPSYSSALTTVKNPTIGTKFGAEKVPCTQQGNGWSCKPDVGRSNCDLNGDGVVGFSSTKAGFSDEEKWCNGTCMGDTSLGLPPDPDCSEWNNYLSRGTVKVKFGAGNGLLFFDPSALPTFDTLHEVGPNKIAELRGTIRVFVGPNPYYTIQPRCDDDLITVGQDPTTIKDAQHACVRPRVGADAEGSN